MNGVDTPVLIDWAIVHIRPTDYPECVRYHLTGIGFGHPRLPDGVQFLTTAVQEIDPNEEWGRTRSRIYNLRRKLEPAKFSAEVASEIEEILQRAYRATFDIGWMSVEQWREIMSRAGQAS